MAEATSTATVAPYGGTKALLSPNPMALAYPTNNNPVIIDISASITTNNMIADKISIRILLPCTALIRGLVNFSAYLIDDPLQGPWFYIVVPLIHGAHYPIAVCMLGYVQKMYPTEIRGMLQSVYALF